MPTDFNKVIVSGTLYGTEVWSVNPCFSNFGGANVSLFADLQTWATAVVARTTATLFGATLMGSLSTAGTVNRITTQYYGSDGRLAQQAQADFTAGTVGTGGPNKTFQDSIVGSLRTGRPGRSYRGRLYWPALSTTTSPTTGRLSAVVTQAYATAFASMLNQIGAAAPVGFTMRPAVVSQTVSISSAIQTVQVGDVMDTQRRRRDAEVEAYTSAPV